MKLLMMCVLFTAADSLLSLCITIDGFGGNNGKMQGRGVLDVMRSVL